MSDFLTRMAQYSRGEAEVVTPVLAGLFGQQAESEPVEPVVDVSGPKGSGVLPDTETVRPAVAAEKGILQQPATQKRVEPEQSVVAEPLFSQPERKRGGDEQRAVSPESLIAESPSADLHDSAHLHVVANEQVRLFTAVGARSLAEESFQTAAATENGDAPPVAGIRRSANRHLIVTAEPASLLVPREENTSLTGDAQSASQHDMVERATLAGQGVQNDPAIHITIGRIDVRAQTTPPVAVAPRSRPKNESSLSLNAYLKRGGGKS